MASNQYSNLGPRIATAGGFQVIDGAGFFSGTGFPKSGTAGTTVKGGRGASPGSLYLATTNDVLFVNEGTITSPYWTPATFQQRGLLGWYSDFRDGLGVAVTDTATSTTLSGSGIRLHGAGIDSSLGGLVVDFVATDGKGAVALLSSGATDAHISVLSVGTGTVPVFQPDQNGTMVIDVNIANVTNLTAKAVFCGFSGLGTALLPPLMTYATTTITNVAVDIAGLTWSSELTLASDWCHVNFDVGAGGTLLAAARDTGVDAAAAETYQRLRVEVDADGVMRTFIDKVLKSTSAAAAVDVDEEFNPQLYIETSAAAAKDLKVRHFSTWGAKV